MPRVKNTGRKSATMARKSITVGLLPTPGMNTSSSDSSSSSSGYTSSSEDESSSDPRSILLLSDGDTPQSNNNKKPITEDEGKSDLTMDNHSSKEARKKRPVLTIEIDSSDSDKEVNNESPLWSDSKTVDIHPSPPRSVRSLRGTRKNSIWDEPYTPPTKTKNLCSSESDTNMNDDTALLLAPKKSKRTIKLRGRRIMKDDQCRRKIDDWKYDNDDELWDSESELDVATDTISADFQSHSQKKKKKKKLSKKRGMIEKYDSGMDSDNDDDSDEEVVSKKGSKVMDDCSAKSLSSSIRPPKKKRRRKNELSDGFRRSSAQIYRVSLPNSTRNMHNSHSDITRSSEMKNDQGFSSFGVDEVNADSQLQRTDLDLNSNLISNSMSVRSTRKRKRKKKSTSPLSSSSKKTRSEKGKKVSKGKKQRKKKKKSSSKKSAGAAADSSSKSAKKPPRPEQYQSDREIKVSDNGKFECRVCEKQVMSLAGIRSHYKRSHEPWRLPAECSICKKSHTSYQTIEEHIESAHKKNPHYRFLCGLKSNQSCDFQSNDAKEWRDHFLTKHDFFMPNEKWSSFDQVRRFNDDGCYKNDESEELKDEPVSQQIATETELIMSQLTCLDDICNDDGISE